MFQFIDFLDTNKAEYIEKYIPLCDELKELDKQRNSLNPTSNYKDKQSYDNIQKQIKEKFEPITKNIYQPITDKLKELGIWSGDDVCTSIWNNNISEISDFKINFSEEDTKKVFQYKQKYLNFRTDTKTDFLCLSFVFSNLDEIFKELFDFFKDTNENEFQVFEAKTIEVKNFTEFAKSIKEGRKENVKYSIPIETFVHKKEAKTPNNNFNIKNEIIMRDKIEIGNISNNNGQISIGKKNHIEVNTDDVLSKKSFNWTKWSIIIGTILTIVSIIATVIYS